MGVRLREIDLLTFPYVDLPRAAWDKNDGDDYCY